MSTPPQVKKAKPAPARMFQSLKGMQDVLPQEQVLWDRIERTLRDLAEFYNFGKIDTPILEFAELFNKTSGEESDVVQKEMYTLRTKGGDMLALRPEFTPAIMRAYLEHGMSRMGQPQKLFYAGPVFRHDKPQLGRYRQFTQAGFEVISGPNDPLYDAQVIQIFLRLLETLKIKGIVLKINSIGCRVCRPIYKRQLTNYYKDHEKELCENCARRLKTNPLRLLDCKEEACLKLKEKAPNFLDKLCVTCSHHFKGVLEYLDELKISYALDNHLVRGLDYYSRTVFEFYTDGPGAEAGALVAGGRYDYLMEMIGGHLTPAVGGAAGIDRIIVAMKAQETKFVAKPVKRVFLAHAGELAKRKSLPLIEKLREAGISVSENLAKESLKAQLKAADKEGIALALILGQKEIYEESVIMRDLRTGLQENIPLVRIVDEIKKRWKAGE